MFPPSFDYRRAESVSEALDLLATEPGAELLAGGHSLIPDIKNEGHDPGTLIDVSEIDALSGIDHAEDFTRIGALTTYADLLRNEQLSERFPVLTDAASTLGDRQIRNMGTIGGNLAYADPGADLPAAVIATDAVIEIEQSDSKREVAAESFFVGEKETAIADDEMITAVRIPRHEESDSAYVKKTHPATGYALVGVAVSVVVDDVSEEITHARIAANGAFKYARRLRSVEKALVGSSVTDDAAIADAVEQAADTGQMRSDPHASGEFRAHLLSVYAERAISDAVVRRSDDRTAQ